MEINILSRHEFSKQFRKLNEKTEDQSYSSGCIMGYFDSDLKKVSVDKKDLYNDEENNYGLEIEPHVTVLYGLKDNEIEESDVVKLFSMIDGPVVSTEKISLFSNEKYDVVKWDVDSEELVLLNKMVTSMFPYKSDFPDYHAHVTIAYCQPGKGKTYEDKLKKPVTKKIAYWVYSKADGKKIKIVPGKEPEILRDSK